jgi:hypothetical protein
MPFVTSALRFPPELRYKGKVLPNLMNSPFAILRVDPGHPITRDPAWGSMVAEATAVQRRDGDLREETRVRKGRGEDIATLQAGLRQVEREKAKLAQNFKEILARWLGGTQKSVTGERLAKLRDFITRATPIPRWILQSMLQVDPQTFEEVVFPRARELGAKLDGNNIRFDERNVDTVLDGMNQMFVNLVHAEREKEALN